jgi:predicted Zn-dependent protease
MEQLKWALAFSWLTALIGSTIPSAAGAFDLGGWNTLMQHAGTGAEVVTSLRKGVQDLTPEEEYYIGRSVAAQVLGSYRPLENPSVNRYLNELGGYLVRFSPRPETFGGYHFELVDSPEINAFAAPGGFILVTSGLYRMVASEEELAAVLAHEISHVTLQHGLSAIRTSNLTKAFTLIGQSALERSSQGRNLMALTDAFDASIDDIVNKMVVSGYSRDQEFAADRAAVAILRAAHYDPAGLGSMLTKLERYSGSHSTGFYKTHPPASERLAAIRGELDQASSGVEGVRLRDRRFQKYRLM